MRSVRSFKSNLPLTVLLPSVSWTRTLNSSLPAVVGLAFHQNEAWFPDNFFFLSVVRSSSPSALACCRGIRLWCVFYFVRASSELLLLLLLGKHNQFGTGGGDSLFYSCFGLVWRVARRRQSHLLSHGAASVWVFRDVFESSSILTQLVCVFSSIFVVVESWNVPTRRYLEKGSVFT